MIRKIIHILLGIGIPLATLAILGFTAESNKSQPCSRIEISIADKDAVHFIAADDVRQMIDNQADHLEGHPIGPGLLARLKKQVEANPYVQTAAIYRSIEGDLHVKISQRRPIARVINTSNQSFYIDNNGLLMPFSDDYTARVMLASGSIHAAYSPVTDLVEMPNNAVLPATELRLRALYKLALYIDADPFWKAMIDQIYVTNNGEFELVPVNGAHIIEFGHADNLDEKFNKLMAFYRFGIGQVGWNYYKRINLKYHKQVVCAK